MARVMSDAEIRRRKKVQGTVSRTTSTLGLAGVGVGTAAALASKKPGALKQIRRAPGMKNTTAAGLKDAGLYTSLASGGIGGVGGYNFAAYTGAESRKRKPVVKGWGGDAAQRTANAATKARLKAPKKPKSDARNDYYQRGTRKFRNLTERSHRNDETGQHKISPMRSRTFAPLEHQYHQYGGRTGTNWEFNGNKRVRKNMDTNMDQGYFGEEGNPLSLQEIEKAWSPVASNFDSERSRNKRSKGYENAALVGAGAGGAYTAHHGTKAVGAAKKLKPINMAHGEVKPANKAGDKRFHPKLTSPGNIAHEKAVPVKAFKPALKSGGKAAAGVAAVGAAAGAHGALKRKRKGSWQPYAKRDTTSPFGVEYY